MRHSPWQALLADSATGTDSATQTYRSEIGPYLTRLPFPPCCVRDLASTETAEPWSPKSESKTGFEIPGDGALGAPKSKDTVLNALEHDYERANVLVGDLAALRPLQQAVAASRR